MHTSTTSTCWFVLVWVDFLPFCTLDPSYYSHRMFSYGDFFRVPGSFQLPSGRIWSASKLRHCGPVLLFVFDIQGSGHITNIMTLGRNILGGIFPLITDVMFTNLGYPAASSLLGGIVRFISWFLHATGSDKT